MLLVQHLLTKPQLSAPSSYPVPTTALVRRPLHTEDFFPTIDFQVPKFEAEQTMNGYYQDTTPSFVDFSVSPSAGNGNAGMPTLPSSSHVAGNVPKTETEPEWLNPTLIAVGGAVAAVTLFWWGTRV